MNATLPGVFANKNHVFEIFVIRPYSHYSQVYSEPCQTSKMELFLGKHLTTENRHLSLQKTPSLIFDRVLNTPLLHLCESHFKEHYCMAEKEYDKVALDLL